MVYDEDQSQYLSPQEFELFEQQMYELQDNQ